MNINTNNIKFYSVLSVCLTIIFACILLFIRTSFQAAPERNTSKERVDITQIQTISNIAEKQLEITKHELFQQSLIRSNEILLQQQELLENEKRSSNRLAFQAELTSKWKTELDQLIKQKKATTQLELNLKYNELKSNLQLKYGISDENVLPSVTSSARSSEKIWIRGELGPRQDRNLGAVYVDRPPPSISTFEGIYQLDHGMWAKKFNGKLMIYDEVRRTWIDANTLQRIYIQNGLRTYN